MKKAFTMLELVFVIVVVGILSTIAISKMNTNDLLNGAEMLAKDIEYTRHLAIIDDNRKINNEEIKNNNKYYNFWMFKILNPGDPKISIFKHINATDYYGTKDNAAIDYIDKNKILAVGSDDKSIENKTSSRVFLKKTYGIKRFDLKDCNTPNGQVNIIMFNEEGVPYGINMSGTSVSNFGKFEKECVIKIEAKNKTKCIVIYPQTGYVKVKDCS